MFSCEAVLVFFKRCIRLGASDEEEYYDDQNIQVNFDKQVSTNQTRLSSTNPVVLSLTVVESEYGEVGASYQIYPTGMKNCRRPNNDGQVYAGTLPNVNDILLQEQERGAGKHHFIIKFSQKTNNFRIKDLGEGTGTFIRLDDGMVIDEELIISFGDSHMMLTPEIDGSIKLVFLEGPRLHDTFSFSKESPPISLGRRQDCTIVFDDFSMSRYQCLIEFNEDRWFIFDGNKKNPSTNGTWIFVMKKFVLQDEMVFKAGQTLFRVNIEAVDKL